MLGLQLPLNPYPRLAAFPAALAWPWHRESITKAPDGRVFAVMHCDDGVMRKCAHALTSVCVVAVGRIFLALGAGADLSDRLGRQSPQGAPDVAKYVTHQAHLLWSA